MSKTNKEMVDSALLNKREVEIMAQMDILIQLIKQIENRISKFDNDLIEIHKLQERNLQIAREQVKQNDKKTT